MLVSSAVYAVVCAVVSLFLIKSGAEKARFIAGLAIATAALNINFELLGVFVDHFMKDSHSGRAALIYAGRLLLYGVLAVISFFIGKTALFGFAAGIFGVTPGVISILIKEAQNNG
ncbi:MAG: hypothetical protein ACI4LM_02910 [Anaerovoracaceae bacterium]